MLGCQAREDRGAQRICEYVSATDRLVPTTQLLGTATTQMSLIETPMVTGWGI